MSTRVQTKVWWIELAWYDRTMMSYGRSVASQCRVVCELDTHVVVEGDVGHVDHVALLYACKREGKILEGVSVQDGWRGPIQRCSILSVIDAMGRDGIEERLTMLNVVRIGASLATCHDSAGKQQFASRAKQSVDGPNCALAEKKKFAACHEKKRFRHKKRHEGTIK